VDNCEGYITLEELPAVYTQSRLALSNERKRAGFSRASFDEDPDDDMKRRPMNLPGLSLSSHFGGLARMLSGGGAEVSFLSQATGGLRGAADMFSADSSDEDDDDESHRWPSNAQFGASIDQLEDEDPYSENNMHSEPGFMLFGGFNRKSSSSPDLQGEAPPSPIPQPEKETGPPQLEHEPQGDEPHPVSKIEGQLDGSEDPLKAAASA
jgi:hypothetical protein